MPAEFLPLRQWLAAGMANILVVDDEEVMRAALAVLLRRDGHAVTVSTGTRDALERFEAGGFDAVVTDIMMPDIDGLALIRELRLRSAGVTILAMSGAGGSCLGDAQRLGATRTVQKPFVPPEFHAALAAAAG
jgi:CheY-like chemotaxis protein